MYKLYTLDATVYATPYCNKIMTTDTQIFKVYKDNTPSRKSQQKIWQAIKPAFTHNVYFSLKKPKYNIKNKKKIWKKTTKNVGTPCFEIINQPPYKCSVKL